MQGKTIYIYLFICCCTISGLLRAQSDSFRVIKGLPTNEVYDLVFDSKGLLWVGHDLGLSSYDGKTFRNYSNNMQASKAITGMVEDNQGRIWCHNFSGQIFWVKNGIMHLLKEYDAGKELDYPRIAICNNELVASSDKGFFVYNLETQKAKYIETGMPISTLVVVGNYAYAVSFTHMYAYSSKEGLTKIPIEKVIPGGKDLRLMFQSQSQGDTIFTIMNPSGRCHRFVVKGKEVRLLDVLQVGSFINDVTCNGSESWLHTKTTSKLLGTTKEITGYNLTDIVTDREGNRWFSSLKYGVMMEPHYTLQKMSLLLPLQKGDYIRAVAKNGQKFFLGTHVGEVFEQDIITGKIEKVFSNSAVGAIEFLSVYDSSHIAICPARGFYLFDIKRKNIRQVFPPILQIKFVDVWKDYTLLGGLPPFMVQNLSNVYDSSWPAKVAKLYPSIKYWTGLNVLLGAENEFRNNVFWLKNERCRAAVFSRYNGAIIAALKNGMVEMRPHEKEKPLLFNDKPVKASGLLVCNDKVFVNSVVGSVLVYDKNGLHALMQGDRPQPENILRQFLVDNEVYILTQDGICIIDGATERVLGYCELSGAAPGNVLDIKRVGNHILLVMNDGLYTLPMIKNVQPVSPVLSLSYTIVNGRDTISGKNAVLSHNQSDFRFYLSSPWYTNTDVVYVAYRLLGSNDTSWQYVARTDQAVYYASLPPGTYSFEAKAIHRLSNFESGTTKFEFVIRKPWWGTAFFQIIALLTAIGIIGFLVRRYYLIRLQRQKRFYEKELAVEKERERISADIHDELGGTLSGIKLMTEMAERKHKDQSNVKKELRDIHLSVTGLTQKMREVIWSLSNENNTLDNLLDYLLRRGKEMFVNSNIQFHSQLPKLIPYVQLKGEKRRHIYLAVKEALHNALKHSEASDVYLIFALSGDMLYIQVKDNGKGFSDGNMQHISGLKNMKFRMQQIEGDIRISTIEGVDITFSIPIA